MKHKVRRQLIFRAALAALLLAGADLCRKVLPYDPFKTDMRSAGKPPSAAHWFGTDNLGRDVFSRVLQGSQTSLYTAICIVLIVFLIGTVIGIVSGYLGGIADTVIMKIITIFQAFPSFILAVAVAGMLGPGIINGMISLCAVYWTTYARLARSLVQQIRGETYIKAAKLCGASKWQIMLRYIMPNMIAPLAVTAALDVGSVILSMAGLSFLGLGAQRPTAEWGVMMSEARTYLQTAPWIILFPGLALFISVIIFNLLGDSVRDSLDARTERNSY
ncbi:MAG: ABC transporter permease [Eubacteriales bacterium]|nr:ABC transporter permease [Eubacteriales bacterium]